MAGMSRQRHKMYSKLPILSSSSTWVLKISVSRISHILCEGYGVCVKFNGSMATSHVLIPPHYAGLDQASSTGIMEAFACLPCGEGAEATSNDPAPHS